MSVLVAESQSVAVTFELRWRREGRALLFPRSESVADTTSSICSCTATTVASVYAHLIVPIASLIPLAHSDSEAASEREE